MTCCNKVVSFEKHCVFKWCINSQWMTKLVVCESAYGEHNSQKMLWSGLCLNLMIKKNATRREEITLGGLIENNEQSQNTREEVRIKQRKVILSWLGIEPRTIVYAPLCSDH